MPYKTFAFKSEKCSKGKLSKQRVTVLVGSNMNIMNKLKVLVFGKSLNPRCIKNARNLLYDNESQSKAWMPSNLFVKWIGKFYEQ